MRKRNDHGLVTTSVILEKQQVARLEALAAVERRSRSFVLRDVIERGLTAMTRHTAPEAVAR
jgi:predicted DNA-binding protein